MLALKSIINTYRKESNYYIQLILSNERQVQTVPLFSSNPNDLSSINNPNLTPTFKY